VRYTSRGTSYLLHRLGFARRCPSTGPPSVEQGLVAVVEDVVDDEAGEPADGLGE
jgi:hypothetical protein